MHLNQTKITTNKKFYDNNTYREQHTHETGENASIRRCRRHHRHTSRSIIKTLKEKANHDFMDRDDDVKQICAKTCK